MGRAARGVTQPPPRLLAWLEFLLLAGGTAALVWCALVVTDAYVVQRLARAALESMQPVTPPASPRVSSAPRPASSPAPAARGTPVASLSIPRLGLSAMVLQGTDPRTLRRGLGHIEATPLPGGSGNVAITGHRDTFFRPLRKIRAGDDIWMDTAEDRLHYRVSWIRVVGPREVSVIAPTREPLLTLVTCYPFRFIGPAPKRFVVRAIRVDNPAAECPNGC